MQDYRWEDNLVERKVESDLKDLLKTLVGFANSVRPGHIAALFIGEKDDGSAPGVTDPDSIQRRIRTECEKIYPSIIWRSQVYLKKSKPCVRVEVEYSGETPHFAGPAWIRRGSETIKASEEVLQRLIDLRSGMVREISRWIDKEVTVYGDLATVPPTRVSDMGFGGGVNQIFQHRWPWSETTATVVFVNSFWVTLQRTETSQRQSEPLEKITLSFDDERDQLMMIVRY